MSIELVKASTVRVSPTGKADSLRELVERAGRGRFIWDEFCYAEHHNLHTQNAYIAAFRRFMAWTEG
jgi:hypothetical protein